MLAVAYAGGPGPGAAQESPPTPVAILTPDDDLRLLVRGVMTLHHRPVLLEGSGPEFLRLLESTDGTLALVFDVGDGSGRWGEDLGRLLAARPDVRAIVLLPAGRADLAGAARAAGAKAVLLRPVGLAELTKAVEAVGEDGAGCPPSGTSGPSAL